MTTSTLPNDGLTLAAETFYSARESTRCSARTLEAYRLAVGKFIAWLREHGVSDARTVTPSHVRAYFASLTHHGYTGTTIHDYARPVKTFLRFLYGDGLLASDVMAKVTMPRQDNRILPAFTQDEAKLILAACESERDRAICLFMLDTGVRAAELCALLVSDYNPKTGATLIRHGKGGQDRIVYAGTRTRQVMLRYLLSRRYRQPDSPLFPSSRDGGPFQRNGLYLVLRRIGLRSGVPNCNPHTFRRTFALWSLRAGMDIYSLQRLMGHADLAILRRYLALEEVDVAGAHREHGAVDALL